MADSPSLLVPPTARPSAEWPDWPEFGLINDLLPTLERWAAAERKFALATLIAVDGSSPRPVGSEMAVSEAGECVGYVSGGCVEAAVAEEALAALKDGKPRLLDYGVGSPVMDLRLSCGGRIRILVQPMVQTESYVARLREARALRTPLIVATELATGSMRFEGETQIGEREGWFFQRHIPKLRLVVVGGDAVTLALARLAPSLDFELTLLRPNGPDQPPAGIAPIHYIRQSVEAALPGLQLDAWSAIYTLTHDADSDHLVLMHALRSSAFCVGALGSRRRATERRARLLDAGLDKVALKRLDAPAGLWIGATTPQQIALSILARIVSVLPR